MRCPTSTKRVKNYQERHFMLNLALTHMRTHTNACTTYIHSKKKIKVPTVASLRQSDKINQQNQKMASWYLSSRSLEMDSLNQSFLQTTKAHNDKNQNSPFSTHFSSPILNLSLEFHKAGRACKRLEPVLATFILWRDITTKETYKRQSLMGFTVPESWSP